jgi:hypothetical protein
MINLVESSPTAMDGSAANSDLKEAEAGTQVASSSGKGLDEKEKVSKAWILEYDLALLEEIRNFNAHILEPKEKTKNFENVTTALINRGIPFKNPRTIMDRFSYLKRMHTAKMAKQQSTSGVENFSDEDPLADLMEDLLQDIMDNEAMKDESKKEKQSKEEQLVAGGKALHEKCAVQILNGKAKPISGDEVSFGELRASPTMSEISATGSDSGSKKKTSRNLFFNDYELIENEKKKMEFEKTKFEEEMNLRRDEMKTAAEQAKMQMDQQMQIHRDTMAIQKQQIDAQVQSIQFQITRHNDDMKMRFLELEQKLKSKTKE